MITTCSTSAWGIEALLSTRAGSCVRRGPRLSAADDRPARARGEVRSIEGSASGRWRGEHLAEARQHVLLALAHALGVEAHEAALLGRVRGVLRRRQQPLADRGGLVGRGLLRDDRVARAELLEGLRACHRALARLDPAERALVLARVLHSVAGDRSDQPVTAGRGAL